jgi:hypothetical protein
MVLEVVNASVVLGLMNLTLVNVTLAAIMLGNFVVLHNVTAPGLSAPVTYGIYAEGPVSIVNGIYVYANSTLYFDRWVNAAPCMPIKVGDFYVLTPQVVVVVGQVSGSCRYLAFISPNSVDVYGIPHVGQKTQYRNSLYWLPYIALMLSLPLVYIYIFRDGKHN